MKRFERVLSCAHQRCLSSAVCVRTGRNRIRTQVGLQGGWELGRSHPWWPVLLAHRLSSGAVAGGNGYSKHREVYMHLIYNVIYYFVQVCFLNCSDFRITSNAQTAHTSQCFFISTETCERWETYSANSGTRCHCRWKTKVCNIKNVIIHQFMAVFWNYTFLDFFWILNKSMEASMEWDGIGKNIMNKCDHFHFNLHQDCLKIIFCGAEVTPTVTPNLHPLKAVRIEAEASLIVVCVWKERWKFNQLDLLRGEKHNLPCLHRGLRRECVN